MMLDRHIIINTLKQHLEPLPFVHTMWEAGSAAFDRIDQFSDIDLHIITEDDGVEATFEVVDTALSTLSTITQRERIPEPTWHGCSQCFYTLADAPPFLLIDCAVIKMSNEEKFDQPETHGTPQILFDKTGTLTQTPKFDWDEHFVNVRARLDAIAETWPKRLPYVRKEVLRGDPLAAAHFYRPFVLNPIVEVLRMMHDPARYGWGMRYLRFYLPEAERKRLEALVYHSSLAELSAAIDDAERWFDELVVAIREKHGW